MWRKVLSVAWGDLFCVSTFSNSVPFHSNCAIRDQSPLNSFDCFLKGSDTAFCSLNKSLDPVTYLPFWHLDSSLVSWECANCKWLLLQARQTVEKLLTILDGEGEVPEPKISQWLRGVSQK